MLLNFPGNWPILFFFNPTSFYLVFFSTQLFFSSFFFPTEPVLTAPGFLFVFFFTTNTLTQKFCFIFEYFICKKKNKKNMLNIDRAGTHFDLETSVMCKHSQDYEDNKCDDYYLL